MTSNASLSPTSGVLKAEAVNLEVYGSWPINRKSLLHSSSYVFDDRKRLRQLPATYLLGVSGRHVRGITGHPGCGSARRWRRRVLSVSVTGQLCMIDSPEPRSRRAPAFNSTLPIHRLQRLEPRQQEDAFPRT